VQELLARGADVDEVHGVRLLLAGACAAPRPIQRHGGRNLLNRGCPPSLPPSAALSPAKLDCAAASHPGQACIDMPHAARGWCRRQALLAAQTSLAATLTSLAATPTPHTLRAADSIVARRDTHSQYANPVVRASGGRSELRAP